MAAQLHLCVRRGRKCRFFLQCKKREVLQVRCEWRRRHKIPSQSKHSQYIPPARDAFPQELHRISSTRSIAAGLYKRRVVASEGEGPRIRTILLVSKNESNPAKQSEQMLCHCTPSISTGPQPDSELVRVAYRVPVIVNPHD